MRLLCDRKQRDVSIPKRDDAAMIPQRPLCDPKAIPQRSRSESATIIAAVAQRFRGGSAAIPQRFLIDPEAKRFRNDSAAIPQRSLRSHCAIAAESLCKCCESLCGHCETDAQSPHNCHAIATQLPRNRCTIVAKSLRNRCAQSLRNCYAITAQSLRNS